MGLRIKTNIESLVAQRQMNENRQTMGNSLERLSSGLRINRSSDDAAGLAISETMQAKIQSFSQAKRNANDGISYLQIAEGSLDVLSNIVIRMRELTMQAASDTLGEKDRSFLDKEFQELSQEVLRIQEQTEFNGIRLLNPKDNNRDLSVQVGVDFRGASGKVNPKDNAITLRFGDLNALNDALANLATRSLQGEDASELGGDDPEEVFGALDDAMDEITGARATIGAIQSRMNSAISTLEIGSENLSAAQSRVRDLDYAEETAHLAQARILFAAGTSVLAQANQMPESVLQLLH